MPENAAKEAQSKDAGGLPAPPGFDDEDDESAKCFKVLLEKIENDPVKISRKNCCTISLTTATQN